MAFDTTTRKRLSDFVADARRLLTEEFAEQLQSLYGISVTGDVAPLERLTHLDAEGLELAATLRQRIAYLISASPEARDATRAAVDRLTREQAFTVLNRLAAIRMAEKRGLIVESVGQQYQSKGFKVFESVAGSAIGESYDRYRCYLFCLFDELAIDLGALFDRRSPQALLFPREKSLLALLGLLDEADLQDLWAEDETIGWIYQYYNDPAERKKMREESAAPRNSRELAVRNQFFTPRYVVEFLTDNTLGRIWYEMTQGVTMLKEQCRYLVRRPTEIFLKPDEGVPEQPTQDGLSQEDLLKQPVFIPHRPLKDPRSILMLDPACGSMHFGLYAFDLFEAIYEEAWEIANGSDEAAKNGELFAPFCAFAASFSDKSAFQREVPRMIVEHNLHGIDIDPRAAQIAGLSLWLRAQRAWNDAGVKPVDRPRITRSNIVSAEPMPGDKVILAEFVEQQFPEGERAAFRFLLETVFDKMMLAGEAGSLLKIEEEIRTAIAEAKKLWEKEPQQTQRMLFGGGDDKPEATQKKLDLSGITDQQFWEGAEERIYAALRDYAEQSETGGFQRRLFAEDAARGFAFIDVCRKRYDVVLMNPPFGEAAITTRAYVEHVYSESKSDIGMAFVRGFISRLSEHGYLGAITNRVFIGNDSLQEWRDEYLLGKTSSVRSLIDLGYGVLDGALVEAAAYTVTRCDHQQPDAVFFRALDSRDKEGAVSSWLVDKTVQRGAFVFLRRLSDFIALPGHVLAYNLPLSLCRRIVRGETLSALGGKAAVGLQPSDDFRFVRLAWEVPPDSIGQSKAWVFYAKGGEYQPYWDDIHLVVNWANDGAEIRNFYDGKGKLRSRPQNVQYYFRSGVTWPERTTSDFSPRVLPAQCIFSVVGQGIFTGSERGDLLYIAGSYARGYKLIIDAIYGSGDASVPGSAATHYRSGVLADLPTPLWIETDAVVETAKLLVRDAIIGFKNLETSRLYSGPFGLTIGPESACRQKAREKNTRVRAMLESSKRIDSQVANHLGFSSDDLATVSVLVGRHPADYDAAITEDDSTVARDLWNLSESDLMSAAVERRGARRQLTKKSFVADRRSEVIAHAIERDARCVNDLVAKNGLLEPESRETFSRDVISWAVGCAFGRWDIRCAAQQSDLAPWLGNPFSPLPACSPAQLKGDDGLPVGQSQIPAGYGMPIAPDGILVADAKHSYDLTRQVQACLRFVWGTRFDEYEAQLCAMLPAACVGDYLVKPLGFFADHLKQYSQSRRQAPIYWPLSTKSGSYTLWIYYHQLNDQTLHKCIADFLDPKIKDVESELGKLAGKDSGRAADLRDFLNELKDLKDEIERVIKLPWKPNLNDGVLITACPLWKLFRLSKWQKDLKACWQELEKGDYDWAHLAYTIWPERVEKVCEKDRSIAIAHGLEHLCKVEPPKPKKPRGKKASS